MYEIHQKVHDLSYFDSYTDAEIEIVNEETNELLVRYTVNIDKDNVDVKIKKWNNN